MAHALAMNGRNGFLRGLAWADASGLNSSIRWSSREKYRAPLYCRAAKVILDDLHDASDITAMARDRLGRPSNAEQGDMPVTAPTYPMFDPMRYSPLMPLRLTARQARHIWIRAQRLDTPEPFGGDAEATRSAIEHLGYVQIDTIHVIERCHHHILWSRIPQYRREHLHHAQAVEKTVFEYWTHALSYVPVRDLPYYLPAMRRHRSAPSRWFSAVTQADVRKIVKRIEVDGPLSIRDIDDDELREKDHPWASRKPSKRALQLAFYNGLLTISERVGMVKTYELMHRHFGWEVHPKPASERAVVDYLLDRALRAQGIVSLDSICHLDAARKPAVREAIEARVKRRRLQPVEIEGFEKIAHWIEPEAVDVAIGQAASHAPMNAVHILSPFDPLIIQRKRLSMLFGYEHKFEAYLPKEKRVFGYFGLPVLADDEIVAVIDLKADREQRRLLIQQWTWVGVGKARAHKKRIEEVLHRFDAFQFAE
jgi:uncharacterized protein YcaQ